MTNITDLTLEQQVVARCIRGAFGRRNSVMTFEFSAVESPDWESVLTFTFRQAVACIVYSGLKTIDGLIVPNSARARLRIGAADAVVRTRSGLEPSLRTAIDVLTSHEMQPIVLKGVALAYTAYERPDYRSLSDIDLLLPGEQLEHASDALRDHGFWIDGDAPRTSHHLQVHRSTDGQIAVELHNQLLPSPHPYSIDIPLLRTRSRVERVAGVDVLVLSPSDALHHACIHLSYSHRYQRFPLRSLIDILAITTNRGAELDWEQFVDTVSVSRTAGAVYWPLRLSRTWLAAPVPDWVLTCLAPPRAIRWLIERVVEPRYVLDSNAPDDAGSKVLFDLIRELSLNTGCSPARQIGAIGRCLFPPPDAVGHLPATLKNARFRYAAYLSNPRRVFRGMMAFRRLMLRRSFTPSGTHVVGAGR